MRVVVFDIDGTLLNNHAEEDMCFAEALRDTLKIASLDTNWSHYTNVSDDGVASEAYHRAFGTLLPPALRDATVAHFVALLQAHESGGMAVIPGARAIFESLERAGWAVALATGAWRDAARVKLAAAGIVVGDRAFSTSEDGPARVDIVRAAIRRAEQQLGIRSFARVVSVGDGVWDVATRERLAFRLLELAVVRVLSDCCQLVRELFCRILRMLARWSTRLGVLNVLALTRPSKAHKKWRS